MPTLGEWKTFKLNSGRDVKWRTNNHFLDVLYDPPLGLTPDETKEAVDTINLSLHGRTT